MTRRSKHLYTACLGVFSALMVFALVQAPFAEAGPGDRDSGRGYFTNARAPGYGKSVIVGGLPSSIWSSDNQATRRSRFINFIENKIDGGGRDRTGGQFIVQLMRGSPYDHNRPSASDLSDWRNRLQGVNMYVRTVSYRWDSAYDSGHNDDYFFYMGRTEYARSLVFTKSGRVVFQIRIECGNPVGDLPGLPEEVERFNMSGYVVGQDASGRRYTGSTSESAANTYITVRRGDRVRAYYYLHNSGPDTARNIYWRARNVYAGTTVSSGTRSSVGDDATVTVYSSEIITIPSNANNGDVTCRDIYYRPNTHNGGDGNSGNVCFRVSYTPPPPQPIVPTCSRVEVIPSNIDTNTQFRISGFVTYGSTAQLTQVLTLNPQIYIRVTGPGYSNVNNNVQPLGNGTLSIWASLRNIGPLAPGVYRYTYGVRTSNGQGAISCPTRTILISTMPYARANAGDVVTGAPIISGDSDNVTCTIRKNEDAGVVGWNRGSGGSYAGAGTSYAVFAMSHIQDFATGRSTSDPTTLAFANSSSLLSVPSGIFGGRFDGLDDSGGYIGCVPNYYYPQGANYGGGGLPGASGSYQRNGNVTINGGAVPDGRRITIYVNGDAYINGNITYDGSYASVSQIPLFVLVAKGNIYIDNDVTQLDGLYVAQPSGSNRGTRGIVYTCATGQGAAVDPFNASASDSLRDNFYSNCNRPLTVNGAIVARQLKLLRTFGTLSAGTPAETFNASPELWLNSQYLPRDPDDNQGIIGNYDAVVGLPPVL